MSKSRHRSFLGLAVAAQGFRNFRSVSTPLGLIASNRIGHSRVAEPICNGDPYNPSLLRWGGIGCDSVSESLGAQVAGEKFYNGN